MSVKNLDLIAQKLFRQYEHILADKKTKNLSLEETIEYIMNYYENIINAMPGNVYWLDSNCKAIGCNLNVLKMFGFKSINEFKGLSFADMERLGHWSRHATQSFENDSRHVIETGEATFNREEPPIPHHNGKLIHFLSTRVPLFNRQGKVIGIVGISVDITDRKRMEHELKENKKKAEQANQTKTEFLSDTVKEINRPIEKIKKLLKQIPREASQKINLSLLAIENIMKDMENFANFDLIEKNTFSNENYLNLPLLKSNNASKDGINNFFQYYKKFKLTSRESECLYYMVRGMTVKQIGKKLNISPRTIEFYLNNSKFKLECKSKQELISKVFENGML